MSIASKSDIDSLVWRAAVLTLYPEMFPGPLGYSLAGKAMAKSIWQLLPVNVREFGIGPHRRVDDSPAGGGAGMVMRADVLAAAHDRAKQHYPDFCGTRVPTVVFTPRGERFNQRHAEMLAQCDGAILVCGHFEGIDERFVQSRADLAISVGDFVLSGGEIPTMVVLDAVLRLLPGVIGNPASLRAESFGRACADVADAIAQGRDVRPALQHAHYTSPRVWENRKIPEVLLSGNHAEIAKWRLSEAQVASDKVHGG